MAALPYIQLYVADYLADTMHLTTEQHGAYLLLIMNYWQTGKALRVDRLQCVCKLSNDRWLSVKDSLSEFFEEVDGTWYHKRIEYELQKVLGKSKQASMAGKASAAKRAEKKAAHQSIDNKDKFNGRSISVERESNHTDTDTEKIKDTVAERNPRYLPICEKLRDIVLLRRKQNITPSKLKKWSNDIRLMVEIDKVDQGQIESNLEWYRVHWNDNQYVPVIESAGSLRDKYGKLIAAVKRGNNPTPPRPNKPESTKARHARELMEEICQSYPQKQLGV